MRAASTRPGRASIIVSPICCAASCFGRAVVFLSSHSPTTRSLCSSNLKQKTASRNELNRHLAVRPRESGDPRRRIEAFGQGNWIPAFAGMNGVCGSIAHYHSLILKRGAHPRDGVGGRLRHLLDQGRELDARERIDVDAELLGLLQIGRVL